MPYHLSVTPLVGREQEVGLLLERWEQAKDGHGQVVLLVEAELLYQRGLPPQATYVFKHALIQDAAYQSRLKSTRQQYHQRIAQVLEEQFPATDYGLIISYVPNCGRHMP